MEDLLRREDSRFNAARADGIELPLFYGIRTFEPDDFMTFAAVRADEFR
jgi:hypothetical protein